MTQQMPATWSIRRRVLAWLFAGMTLVFAANLASSYYANREAADSAYDQLLLASASAIAERIAIKEGDIGVDLPYVALDMLASTAQDRVFYAVTDPFGDLITGYRDLPPTGQQTPAASSPRTRFYSTVYKGATVRVVSFPSFVSSNEVSGFATVFVAQTRGERDDLAFDLLRQSAIWTLAIALLGAGAAWLGISIGLRPLDRLREALGRRSPEDIRPVLHDVPMEFTPLVGAINGMLARIDNGFDSMRRFISDASHQLKTPLAGLQVQTEMALRESEPDVIQEYISKLNLGVRRTSRLATQLLSHARAADRGVQHTDTDLAVITRSAIAELEPKAVSNRIDLGYEGDDRVSFHGDTTLLTEMVANLIDNAIKYAPVDTAVTVSVRAEDGTIRLTVDDQGQGIAPEHHEEVFERFVRLPGNAVEGCGLGLAIVREVATQHGGQVELANAPGGGLRVDIAFTVQERNHV